MVLPLHLLISNTKNRYELSVAAIRRAQQLNLTGDEEVEENNGKVVSTAIRQILEDRVKYQLEE